ncbi:amidohydrolase family protein [Dactylosporangium sp. CA-092794]|uniref:amidohydrolase family protein n=1 Tax=Dactylosporangium sp. CA-092794 TaxID=3239929 RepID=UPI003D8D80FD
MSIDRFMEFKRGATGAKRHTLLPDPERRKRRYTVISVDDHVVEPPDTFEGRIPAKFLDRAPRVIDTDDGGQAWLYDGNILPNVGFNATVGRPFEESDYDPTRFEHMRRGAWDVHARLADMDLDGTWASLNFPSFLAGFGGARLQMTTSDADLAFAVFRAYNQWHLEGWAGAAPQRFIPCQLPWLLDPEVGAQEVRRNAELGFRAITFPEAPDRLGLPSLFTTHWDPIMRACAETGTVVCAHTGSAGSLPATAPDAPMAVTGILFGTYAVAPTVDFLYSFIPVRFPDIKIVMSEGGIGWVVGLKDRLEHSLSRSQPEMRQRWAEAGIRPLEALERNFWFCALDNPSSFVTADRIGIDRILLEVDYPHADSTWPDSQAVFETSLARLDAEATRRISWQNASELFRFEVPEAVQNNPDGY